MLNQGVLTSGIIWSSILGSFMFLMYTDDARHCTSYSTPLLCGDNIRSVYSFKPADLVSATGWISHDLAVSYRWFVDWVVNFSPDEYKVVTQR